MSANVRLTDDLLRRALEARAANQVPERGLVDAIAVEVARTPQVRRWPGLPSRWLTGSIATATVAAVVVVAIILANTASGPSVKLIDVGVDGTAAPALSGGRYRSAVFEPVMTFTVRDGAWAPAVDLPSEVQLRSVWPDRSGTDDGSLTVLRIDNVVTDTCGYEGTRPWSAGGNGPDSFVAWLQARLPDGLEAPRPVTVAGRSGLELGFQATTALRQECDFGLLLTDVGTVASPRYAEIPVDGRRVRLLALDISGELVVLITEGGWTNRFEDVAREADALIASMAFE
jgi:hypothetical protein